ncbi:transcriptional regulator [Methanobrevibacter sp. 87.7]|nr:transcriptional regulator [Methanobrevibacter sp. 87.7]
MGKRIKKLRLSQNINQSSVADYLGVNQSTVAKAESGDRSLNLNSLIKLSTLFGCSRDYLLGMTDEYDPLNFAFRSKNVDVKDLEAIAAINKIVLNIDFLNDLKENKENQE